jgi:large subunit ribosomal protein L15
MKRTTPVRKNKSQRGSSGHGWGHKKKHRGAGSRGGKGNAGSGKRADTKKPTIINKYGTANLARRGFVVPDRKEYQSLNLKDLNALVDSGKIKNEVNLKELGYKKILGTGQLQTPLKIIVELASKSAIEKVKNAGGEVILPESN